MNLSEEVLTAIQDALEYAKANKLEFITPEIILLMLTEDASFNAAFTECGGNVQILANNLQEYIDQFIENSTIDPQVSESTRDMIDAAGKTALNSNQSEICIRHLIHGLWQLENSYAIYYMEKQGVDELNLLQMLTNIDDNTDMDNEAIINFSSNDDQSPYDAYAPCLNDTLKDVNPLIGRKTELERTIQILCRKDKNNPLHIGEPGVGKTAITYGLVQLLQQNNVPEPLKGAKVFALDLASILAGTQYRGDFEKRLKKLLASISREDKPIIYIDEIHNLCGAGATGDGSFDASNMLKPYLADGTIRFIGATTFEEYKKYFEKNKSLVRRFQNVEIKEPSEAESIEILKGLKSRYEKYHNVKFNKNVIEYAVNMSVKLIHERCLPDKAIDLLDEAGAYRRLHPLNQKFQTVNKDVINEVLTKICRVPIETVNTQDLNGLATLEKRLKNKVFGQDEAISQVVNAIKFSKAGLLEENKPLASLLFVGPTGVGKTEIAKSLAEELGVKLLRFDMSEYVEKHAVAKLIGSPAGYVGYEEGGLLTEAIRKNPTAILLLDEIEKAHTDIYNILLQIMDYATLTDNQGRKADFRNVVIIMTSNAGANQLGKSNIGFASKTTNQAVIKDEVNRVFQPEFRNRLNKIVVFNSMNNAMAELIVAKKINELSLQLLQKKINFIAKESAKTLIKAKGITQEFGAREVDRIIRNEIKPLFVDEILFGKLKNGGNLILKAKDGFFTTIIE